MNWLQYGEKNCDDMLSRFHVIPERHGRTDRQTDGRTDGRTDRRTELLYQYRASVSWRAIKIIRLSWNFVHSSRFWTGWTSRDQKFKKKSCIGETPSSTEHISCFYKNKITYFVLHLKLVEYVAKRCVLVMEHVNPLAGTLRLHSNGPLYNNTVIGTRLGPSSLYQM